MIDTLTIKDISRVDESGMYDLAKGFVEQLKTGKNIAENADLSPSMMEGIDHVIVVGMGGSAIAGDIVRCFAMKESSVPISVVRNYTLPAFVSARTLVVVSSFSGNTEETLSGMAQAMEAGASIVCITSGGKVKAHADEKGLPALVIPGGIPPRAALGYSLSALLAALSKMGVVAVSEEAWTEAFGLLEEKIALYANPDSDHEALDIARRLENCLPFIYSATGMLETVNVRWRGQIQENSKMLAAGNVYPELNHNEIMGWESSNISDIHKRIGVVVLRDKDDHERIQHRMKVTKELLEEKAGYWVEVHSTGEHPLTRMLSLICLGDWVSLYLAYIREVDPTPIGLINRLKEELAKI